MAFQNIIRQPAATWTSLNPTLDANVLGVESNLINGAETDTLKAKLGDGVHTWAQLSYWNPAGGSGTGDVVGPASATADVPVLFSGTTGKLVKNSTPTGTGNPVMATSPTLTTPTIGVATATSVNKVTITAPATSATLTVADGKTATVNNSITFAGTDSTTMTFPGVDASVGYLNIPQNSQSAAYQFVLADAGKHIYHPVGDNNARQFTIPANATVAFPLGTAITVVNMAATASTMIITSDVLNYANIGAVTTITIPQYNEVTILKILTTAWLASGSGGVTAA